MAKEHTAIALVHHLGHSPLTAVASGVTLPPMPDLNTPLANCMTPPCFTPGQVLEGLAYLVAVLAICGFMLVAIHRLLGGQLANAAPEYESPSGAYALGGWTTAAIQRLPRAWRDETFYEELKGDRSTVAKAATTVMLVALVVAAPRAVSEASDGITPNIVWRFVSAGTASIVGWVLLALTASGVARFVFGRRHGWSVVLAGLGFALSPLLLLALASLHPVGLVVIVVAISWGFALCYIAILGTVQGDQMVTLGITISILIAAFGLWMLARPSFDIAGREPVAICGGIVDGSGACIPMDDLSPAIRTALATPTLR